MIDGCRLEQYVDGVWRAVCGTVAEWLMCWLLSVFELNRIDPGSNPAPTITWL